MEPERSPGHLYQRVVEDFSRPLEQGESGVSFRYVGDEGLQAFNRAGHSEAAEHRSCDMPQGEHLVLEASEEATQLVDALTSFGRLILGVFQALLDASKAGDYPFFVDD